MRRTREKAHQKYSLGSSPAGHGGRSAQPVTSLTTRLTISTAACQSFRMCRVPSDLRDTSSVPLALDAAPRICSTQTPCELVVLRRSALADQLHQRTLLRLPDSNRLVCSARSQSSTIRVPCSSSQLVSAVPLVVQPSTARAGTHTPKHAQPPCVPSAAS